MQKQGAMMVVCTRISPGKEAEYHKWYDKHVNIMFEYPGMERVSRNHLIRPLGNNNNNSPEYIVLYELKEKADLENYFKSPQMDQAKKQFEEDWAGLGDVLWSGFYEPLHVLKRGSIQGKKRFMEIVGSGPKPGKEKAYLDYYVDHFTKMFKYEGIREISYVHMFMPMAQDGKSHGYVTVYDFESEAAMNNFYQSPVFTGAGKEWEEVGQPTMDLQFAACYESVICLER
jgi:antibiotic biosynthesis monooxygenase (ABM) superfamily enzyme